MTTKLVALLSLCLWSSKLWYRPTDALALPVLAHHDVMSLQPQALGRSSIFHQRRDQDDPNDQSWITHWAAIDDSFSAGIGCGFLLDDGCERYNFSFPNLINNDGRMGRTSREFQFLACSGAVSSEILRNQIPQITGGAQVITVTAGGNDADFSGILVDCIYGLRPDSTCDARLTKAGNLMQSEDFKEKINALITATLSKLDEDGRIYYIGYAPFFNAESTQCNDVSWDALGMDFLHTKLTTDLRTRMNVLVSQMNGILGAIVGAADDRVVFVDYSGWVSKVGGRYCEEDVREPNSDNEDAVFYQWSTRDEWDVPDPIKTELKPRDYGNDTFAGQMLSALEESQAVNSSYVLRGNGRDEADLRDAQSTDSDVRERGFHIVPLHVRRTFHPTLMGHSLIANLVLYHMGVERAKMLDRAAQPMIVNVLPSTCSRANEYQDGKIIPQTLDCADIAELSDEYWFDTDTAREVRDNFCKSVGGKSQIDISQSHDMESGLGLTYPYKMSGPGNTWIWVWVQNAGCRRPSLYAHEDVCRVAIDAIVNQCTTETTKKFGGSVAFGTCEEYHMEVGRQFLKFAKTIANSSTSWNDTSSNNIGFGLPVANIAFTRKETNQTTI